MTMTAFQFEGLQILGYTKRESEFLYLVATHSGYFTNRQFKSFAQTESGSVSHAFIRKLLDRNHASYQQRTGRADASITYSLERCTKPSRRENLRTTAMKRSTNWSTSKRGWSPWTSSSGTPKHRYLETGGGEGRLLREGMERDERHPSGEAV